jgi:hypothetical protein
VAIPSALELLKSLVELLNLSVARFLWKELSQAAKVYNVEQAANVRVYDHIGVTRRIVFVQSSPDLSRLAVETSSSVNRFRLYGKPPLESNLSRSKQPGLASTRGVFDQFVGLYGGANVLMTTPNAFSSVGRQDAFFDQQTDRRHQTQTMITYFVS